MASPRGEETNTNPYGQRWAAPVLAASAGGLSALRTVLSGLPPAFPAAILVIMHLQPDQPSRLASILSRATTLRVKEAEEGDWIQPGVVYVAPVDWHLLVTPEGRLTLSHGETVHFVRPSVDVLLASLAASQGERAIAVIMTGTGLDGADGARAVRRRGGTVIVQDPASAEHPGMPQAALDTGCVDLVLPLEMIAAELVELVGPAAILPYN